MRRYTPGIARAAFHERLDRLTWRATATLSRQPRPFETAEQLADDQRRARLTLEGLDGSALLAEARAEVRTAAPLALATEADRLAGLLRTWSANEAQREAWTADGLWGAEDETAHAWDAEDLRAAGLLDEAVERARLAAEAA